MSERDNKTPIMANPLIAVVCDIRGFTNFTSTVDSVNRSEQVDDPIRTALLGDYDNLVQRSQRVAMQTILQPVAEALQKDGSNLKKVWERQHGGKQKPLPCTLKSTGDGYLLAVELAHNYKPVSIALQSALAEPLTSGLINLVRKSKDKGQFRDMLEGFFNIWGSYLATRFEPTTFRVAGAIAIGTGQILDDEDVPEGWTARNFLEEIPGASSVLKLKSDAYGHGVNLAFRLCDRAGRADAGPYVLMDRRIGQLLIDGVRQTNKTPWVKLEWEDELRMPYGLLPTFDGYSLARFSFDKPLKGIDELWCYGLEEKKKKNPPTASARAKSVSKGAQPKKAAKRPSVD